MFFYRQTKLAQGFTWKDLDPNSGNRVKAHRARNSDLFIRDDEQLTSAQLDKLNASPSTSSKSSLMLEAYLHSTPQASTPQASMILPMNVLHLYGVGWIIIESTPVMSSSRIKSAPIMASNRLLPAPVIISSPESTCGWEIIQSKPVSSPARTLCLSSSTYHLQQPILVANRLLVPPSVNSLLIGPRHIEKHIIADDTVTVATSDKKIVSSSKPVGKKKGFMAKQPIIADDTVIVKSVVESTPTSITLRLQESPALKESSAISSLDENIEVTLDSESVRYGPGWTKANLSLSDYDENPSAFWSSLLEEKHPRIDGEVIYQKSSVAHLPPRNLPFPKKLYLQLRNSEDPGKFRPSIIVDSISHDEKDVFSFSTNSEVVSKHRSSVGLLWNNLTEERFARFTAENLLKARPKTISGLGMIAFLDSSYLAFICSLEGIPLGFVKVIVLLDTALYAYTDYPDQSYVSLVQEGRELFHDLRNQNPSIPRSDRKSVLIPESPTDTPVLPRVERSLSQGSDSITERLENAVLFQKGNLLTAFTQSYGNAYLTTLSILLSPLASVAGNASITPAWYRFAQRRDKVALLASPRRMKSRSIRKPHEQSVMFEAQVLSESWNKWKRNQGR